MPACACLHKSVCAPSATGILLSAPGAQDALTCGFGTSQGSFFFPPKEILTGLISLSSGNGRKGGGWIRLSPEIAFMARKASEAW